MANGVSKFVPKEKVGTKASSQDLVCAGGRGAPSYKCVCIYIYLSAAQSTKIDIIQKS